MLLLEEERALLQRLLLVVSFLVSRVLLEMQRCLLSLAMVQEARVALLAQLTPSEPHPRASAVKMDNLVIAVHWPGGPVGWASTVSYLILASWGLSKCR